MTISEKDVKRISVFVLIALLAILAFIVIRPVLLSIIGGLILAYVFMPVQKVILKVVKNSSVAAGIVCIIVLILIVVPLWFLVPITVQQVINLSQYSQQLDVHSIIIKFFPTASEQLVSQIALAANSAMSKVSSAILNSLVSLLVDSVTILLHLVLVAFVFFFTLRDYEHLKEFVTGLSPLSKTQEHLIVNQFEGITKAIVYGQVAIGILQGVLTGLGLIVWGIPNTIVLTILAVILGILPVIGPGLIYVPVTIYLLILGNPLSAIVYFLYNIIFVTYSENVLRAYLVSRKVIYSQAVVLVGMIGGLFIFGILGLILGPLILVYFLSFLKAYKEKNLSSVFSHEE